MKYKYPLTIVTPTYNRREELEKLHKSLQEQTEQSFQWLVIDDGSNDDTTEYMNSILEGTVLVEYHYKKNGGKHTALNYSHPFIQGELTCIVDSDDWLIPDAITIILNTWDIYKDRVQCMSFLKGNSEGSPLEKSFEKEYEISNHINFRINGNRRKDCCEVICTDTLKEFPFPEFGGEKFMGEGYLWNNVGFKYDTVYVRKVIYICEYLEGGLTKLGRKLRIKSPKGGMVHSNSLLQASQKNKINFKVLNKAVLLFICYGKFAGFSKKEILQKCNRSKVARINYLFGLGLYYYWNNKYNK